MGVYFCMGGTGKLVAELEALMRRQGIDIRLDTDIEEILVQGERVIGVHTQDGTEIHADRIICNGDPPTIYAEMLPAHKGRRKKALPDKMTRYSMGLYVLFFGTKKKYPDIAHHTIWMGKRYKALLHDIFNRKILSGGFFFISAPANGHRCQLCPGGCDSFYVLCPVPNLQGDVDWKKQGLLCSNVLSARWKNHYARAGRAYCRRFLYDTGRFQKPLSLDAWGGIFHCPQFYAIGLVSIS